MPIKDLQRRLTQVGVIRLGEKRISKNGRPYPAKLSTFRITSPSRDLIERAAAMFGGEVRDWPDGPSGPEFQVTTASSELPVFVLPQRIDPNLELWGNRHRVRMCDGETERIRNVPCLCEQAARQRYAQQRRPWPEDGRFQRDPRSDCKPTTRLSVSLADLSDGQFKIEAHGWNAASELPTKATVYLAMAQRPVPATLRLAVRTDAVLRVQPDGSEKVESREYVVPELDFGDLFTLREALTGGVDAAVGRALAAALQQRQAIAAEPLQVESTRLTPARVVEMSKLARNVGQVQQLWRDAIAAEAMNDDVAAVLTARAEELAPTADRRDETPTTPEPDPVPPAEVVEGEVEPDPDALWMQIQALAGAKGWNTAGIEERIYARFKKTTDEVDGWQMQAFIAAVNGGEVT